MRFRHTLQSRSYVLHGQIQASYGGTSEIMETIIARDLTGLRA
jgi:hypothetical protein